VGECKPQGSRKKVCSLEHATGNENVLDAGAAAGGEAGLESKSATESGKILKNFSQLNSQGRAASGHTCAL